MNISLDCLINSGTYEHSEHTMNHFTDCKYPIKNHVAVFVVYFIIVVIIVTSVCVFAVSYDSEIPQIHPLANQPHTHIFELCFNNKQ